MREPVLNHNGCRWEPQFNLCILVREILLYRIVDAREPLLDRPVLVRKPLLIYVAFLAVKQGISVTCV